MKQEPQSKSTSSSSDESNQSNDERLTQERTSEMSCILTTPMVKRPRRTGPDAPQSPSLALMTATHKHNPQTSVLGPPGLPNLNTRQNYLMLKPKPEPQTPQRSMENVFTGINLVRGSSNYAQSLLRLKRKLSMGQDDITSNPRSFNSFNLGDQGSSASSYGSSTDGFSVYDPRYEAMGVPVDPHLRSFNLMYPKGNKGSM